MTEHSNTPVNHDELTAMLNTAVASGDTAEIDRLMAVEIKEVEPEKIEEEEAVELEEVIPPDDVPKDEPSNGEEKDEAAEPAASTPAAAKQDEQPEDEVTKLRRELHTLKSDAGRVPYMQRRLQELERELRDSKLSRKVAEATPATTDASPEAAIPEKLKQRIAALREIDPDLADTLQEMATSLKGESAKAANVAKEVVQEYSNIEAERQEQEFITQQYQQLVTDVPYAPEVFKSNEWKEWKEKLSPGRRALAESTYADEVKIAIGAFVSDMQVRFGGQKAAEAPVPVQTQQQVETVTKVQENRERKLNAATDTKATAAKGTKPQLNEAELFSQMYDKIRKENHIR